MILFCRIVAEISVNKNFVTIKIHNFTLCIYSIANNKWHCRYSSVNALILAYSFPSFTQSFKKPLSVSVSLFFVYNIVFSTTAYLLIHFMFFTFSFLLIVLLSYCVEKDFGLFDNSFHILCSVTFFLLKNNSRLVFISSLYNSRAINL